MESRRPTLEVRPSTSRRRRITSRVIENHPIVGRRPRPRILHSRCASHARRSLARAVRPRFLDTFATDRSKHDRTRARVPASMLAGIHIDCAGSRSWTVACRGEIEHRLFVNTEPVSKACETLVPARYRPRCLHLKLQISVYFDTTCWCPYRTEDRVSQCCFFRGGFRLVRSVLHAQSLESCCS